MPALSAAPLLLLPALLGGAPLSPPGAFVPGIRRIELRADPPAQVHEVRISPGHGTLLFFDTPLQRGKVVLAGEERFLLATLGENARAYTLLPSDEVRVGEQLPLTVSFADETAPQSVTFQLVVYPGQAERQVNVYRHPRTLDSYRQESLQQQERAEHCETRLAQVLVAQGGEGLAGLEASSLLGMGISVQELNKTLRQAPGNTLWSRKVESFRAPGRVAVRLRLESPSAQRWEAEGAELVSEEGVSLKVLKVWQAQPLHSGLGEGTTVLVEAEAGEKGATGPHVLRLWGVGGARPLTFTHVTFPSKQQPQTPDPSGQGSGGRLER